MILKLNNTEEPIAITGVQYNRINKRVSDDFATISFTLLPSEDIEEIIARFVNINEITSLIVVSNTTNEEIYNFNTNFSLATIDDRAEDPNGARTITVTYDLKASV